MILPVLIILLVIVLIVGVLYVVYKLQNDDDAGKGSGFTPAPVPCIGSDENGIYAFDVNGNCTFEGCKSGYFPQNGACIQFSGQNLTGPSQSSEDCVLDEDTPYIYGQCNPQNPNKTCGPGSGSRLKSPNIKSVAIGGGTCPSSEYINCDITCPDQCTVPDEAYTVSDGAGCMATPPGGTSPVVLGTESGYCGDGTISKTLNVSQVPLQIVNDAGFDTIADYLAYANPNGVCPTVINSACNVPCEGNMQDVGCNYEGRIYETIKDTSSGRSKCFNTEEANQYISGTRSTLPDELPIILATDALNADGTYDETKSKKAGVHILYLSDRGMSSDSITRNKCTLMKTEPCFARQESVNCTITDNKNEAPCEFAGCSQKGYKTVTTQIAQHAFGDGTCPSFETTKNTDAGCTIAQRCCENRDYRMDGFCTTGGVQAYTLNTDDCNNITAAGGTSQPDTKTENCCYINPTGTPVAGYDGCELKDGVWKRKYIRNVVNESLCDPNLLGDALIKYEDDGTCNYDCRVDGITLDAGGNRQIYMNRCITFNEWMNKKVTAVNFRDPRGGKACPGILNQLYNNKTALTNALSGHELNTGVSIADFQCASVSKGYNMDPVWTAPQNCTGEITSICRWTPP